MLIIFSLGFFIILNSFLFNELSFFFVLWFIICAPLFLIQLEKRIPQQNINVESKLLSNLLIYAAIKNQFQLYLLQNKIVRLLLSPSYFIIQGFITLSISSILEIQTKAQVLQYQYFLKTVWSSLLKIKNVK